MKIDKKLFRDGPYSDFFSQGVQVGNILTLAGQLGNSGEGAFAFNNQKRRKASDFMKKSDIGK